MSACQPVSLDRETCFATSYDHGEIQSHMSETPKTRADREARRSWRLGREGLEPWEMAGHKTLQSPSLSLSISLARERVTGGLISFI